MNTLVRRAGLGPIAALALIAVLCAPLTAMADVMLGRTATRFDCAQVAMAMTQVRLASMQNQLARGEAACIRLQASRARMIVLRQLPTPVVCPRERLEMVMPRLPAAPSADPI